LRFFMVFLCPSGRNPGMVSQIRPWPLPSKYLTIPLFTNPTTWGYTACDTDSVVK
jgi:hypothetical protein